MNRLVRRILKVAILNLPFLAVGLGQTGAPAFKVIIGKDAVFTLDRPRPDRGQLTFHRYPDGLLVTIRASAVTTAEHLTGASTPSSTSSKAREKFRMEASESVLVTAKRPGLQPGDWVEIGQTGSSSKPQLAAAALAGHGGGTKYTPRPGEGLQGKALFNPNRDYRPEWDSKLVPGYSMPFPNSPGDYVEGKTLSYPPGNGIQQRPGFPPVLIYDGVDAPKVLSRDGGWAPPLIGSSINPPTTADRGSDVPHVPDVHDVPRISYDPTLPPPGQPNPPKN